MVTRGKSHAEVTSTTQGRKRKMGVDQENAGTLMLMLSQVYSASGESVLREYSNNARDSHLEAGQKRPIEVHLPTDMNPHLVVQDYGIGLLNTGVMDTFTYGRSSKRGSDTFTGHFGIGSKSAFTLTNQFSVTATKDGRRTVVLVSLDEDGEPSTETLSGADPESGDDILSSDPTDEPDGVTISIPVDAEHAETMRASVPKVFGMWPHGTVLVDGKEPSRIRDRVDIDLGSVSVLNGEDAKSLGLDHLTVEMGDSLYGVPNAVRDAFADDFLGKQGSRRKSHAGHFIAHVPMDAVDLVPTREDVRDTSRTRKALAAAVESALDSAARRAGSLLGMDVPSRGREIVALSHPYFSRRTQSKIMRLVPGNKQFQEVPGKAYPKVDVEISIRDGKPLRSDSSQVYIAHLDSVTFIVGASAGNARSVVKKWVFSKSDDVRSTVVIIEPETFTLLGSEVSASTPCGLHVVDYQEIKRFSSVALPCSAPRGKEIEYPVRMLGDAFDLRGEGVTPSRIAAMFEDGDISGVVTQVDRYSHAMASLRLERRLLNQGLIEDRKVLVVMIQTPRTLGAFIGRLRRFSEDVPIQTAAQFRDAVTVPALRPLIDEAMTPDYSRPSVVVDLSRRLDELHPSVREFIETWCPFALHDPDPVSEVVSHHRGELIRLGGARPAGPSFADIALGSELLSPMFRTHGAKPLRSEQIGDVIAILNSRHEIAEKLLAERTSGQLATIS